MPCGNAFVCVSGGELLSIPGDSLQEKKASDSRSRRCSAGGKSPSAS